MDGGLGPQDFSSLKASFKCLSRSLAFHLLLIKKLRVLDWFPPRISVSLYLYGWQKGPVMVPWGFASEPSPGSPARSRLRICSSFCLGEMWRPRRREGKAGGSGNSLFIWGTRSREHCFRSPPNRGRKGPSADVNMVGVPSVAQLNLGRETPEPNACKCTAGAGNLSLLQRTFLKNQDSRGTEH